MRLTMKTWDRGCSTVTLSQRYTTAGCLLDIVDDSLWLTYAILWTHLLQKSTNWPMMKSKPFKPLASYVKRPVESIHPFPLHQPFIPYLSFNKSIPTIPYRLLYISLASLM
jgi:hypothetical protein